MNKLKLVTYPVLFVLLLAASIQKAEAIRAYPHPITVTQPDGSTLTIRVHGDEFKRYRTTEDGYVIKQNTSGFYIYDLKYSSLTDKSTEIIARNPLQRTAADKSLLKSFSTNQAEELVNTSAKLKTRFASAASKPQKAYPLNGSPKSLVILVNFTDKAYVVSTPQTAYTNLLNQSGYSTNGGTGSAKDYFMAASFGNFAPQFDVVGPYTLPQNMAYYGKNDANDEDQNPQQMVIDACTAANNAGIDFTQYDTDNDGFVDNIFVYYAGYNEAEGGPTNTVWPHRWSLADYTTKFDGKTVFDYACTSELNGESGSSMCGIGTFTHEFGHVLGLPDYYHTSDATGSKSTLDEWSIMDLGAYNNNGRTPPTYSAYDRFFLGWFTPQQVSTGSDLTLLPLYQGTTVPANTNQQSYLLSATNHNLSGSSPSPAEFFMVEYRKKTGWDAYLPGEGMLIWHIDYNATAWNDNSPNNYTGSSQTASSHMRVYLQPLTGSTSTPGAAFTTGSFTPTTWSGTNINRPITEIVKTANNVTFKLMGGTPVDPNSPQIVVGKILSSLTFTPTTVTVANVKTLNIKTTDLIGDLTIAVTGTDAAMFKASVATATKDAANSNTGTNITITYQPTAIGQHSATLTISGGGLNPAKVISLSGEGKE